MIFEIEKALSGEYIQAGFDIHSIRQNWGEPDDIGNINGFVIYKYNHTEITFYKSKIYLLCFYNYKQSKPVRDQMNMTSILNLLERNNLTCNFQEPSTGDNMLYLNQGDFNQFIFEMETQILYSASFKASDFNL